MYSKELIERLVQTLAPDGYMPRDKAEARYPKRVLVDEAIVTRSAPSPTGYLHIGTVYMSLINKLVALSSSGVNMLRVEDTDKKREIEHGVKVIVSGLKTFDLAPDEGVDETGHSYGLYGPYLQSERADMYLGYAVDLLERGRAYPCFATAEELENNYKAQQAAKVRPGYYGQWAIWRDKPEADTKAALDAGQTFVLRFRSEGSHEKRVVVEDVLKGKLELPENDLDVPLIKNDGSHLPTYHLAHVVDDHLMQTNMVLRGDEWLPSIPLHMELAQALDIMPFKYAHFAPINIMDGNSKRKLSKRKDPEANVDYFIKAGYPTLAVLEYLLRLANSNFEDWRLENPDKSIWEFKFSFDKWAKARGALLDMNKLNDVSKNFIAGLTQADYQAEILAWAGQHDQEFLNALTADKAYAERVLSIERDGDNKRKDLAKWSDAPDQYGYFFDELFESSFKPNIVEQLADLAPEVAGQAKQVFMKSYLPDDDQANWFEKLKVAANDCGFATDNKEFKANPDKFKGNLADFARIIRVSLTGLNRTPDLWAVMQAMGLERVQRRLS